MGLLYSLDKKYILINTIFEVVVTVNGKIWGFLVCDAVHLRQMAPLKCPTCIPNYTALEYINFNTGALISL
jgi:hypothetical protein